MWAVGTQVGEGELAGGSTAVVDGRDIIEVKRQDPVGCGWSWSADGIVVGYSNGGGDVHIHRWVGEGVVQGLVNIG